MWIVNCTGEDFYTDGWIWRRICVPFRSSNRKWLWCGCNSESSRSKVKSQRSRSQGEKLRGRELRSQSKLMVGVS